MDECYDFGLDFDGDEFDDFFENLAPKDKSVVYPKTCFRNAAQTKGFVLYSGR